MYQGPENLREHFKENRHARNDLFQIYYPKNTLVKDWLIDGPKKAADDMWQFLDTHRKRLERPFTMMEYAKLLEKYFKEKQNFRSPLYPCKNTARYMAMAYPDIVDPESVLFGGTGHFDGMAQIFGVNLNGKVQYEIDPDGQFIPKNKNGELWLAQMHQLRDDVRNPMREQKMLNIEDKTCFFYKHIAISHGVKSPTKRIPYNWIFPETFSLRVE
jgi:alpha-N-acetylglucosamine transferase